MLSILWIRDPVQSCVLHGPHAAGAPQPSALHAYAKAHHHPGLQHGQLQRRKAFLSIHTEQPRYTTAPHYSFKSWRDCNYPSDHYSYHANPYEQLVHTHSSTFTYCSDRAEDRYSVIVTVLSFTRCMRTAHPRTIRHGGLEKCNRPLHNIHRSTSR